jgi:ribosomal protein S18 acetylase RimI-like enzyme
VTAPGTSFLPAQLREITGPRRPWNIVPCPVTPIDQEVWMSASLQLSEAAERAAWTELLAGAPPAVRRELGIDVVRDGDALFLAVAGAASFLVNRAFGVGADPASLARAAAFYRSRGVARYFLHVRGQPEPRALARAGLARYPRAWLKLLRGPQPIGRRDPQSSVEDVAPADLERVAAIYCAAFDLPSQFAPAIAAVHGRTGWSVQVARSGDAAVAVGLLHVRGDVGYLAGGATDPAFRRRGAQGALVTERVRRALERGCLWLTAETGEDVPGDPQHSLHNMRRAGFEIVGSRSNYAPVAMVPGALALAP